jgi:hypothetical protein
MAWRLQGGLDDVTRLLGGQRLRGLQGNFGGKFRQSDDMVESLRGLEFTNVVQWFMYGGTIVATDISDAIRAVATENHSSNGPLPSLDHC